MLQALGLPSFKPEQAEVTEGILKQDAFVILPTKLGSKSPRAKTTLSVRLKKKQVQADDNNQSADTL